MEITPERLKIIAGKEGFNIIMIEKDYLLTYLLYLLRDIKGIYFKGGTALHKVILNHERLSEDLDFTLTRSVKEVKSDIGAVLKNTIFDKITYGRDLDNFTRLIIHYKLFHEEGKIFIDLNEKAKLMLKPKHYSINHFYNEIIPNFSVACLDEKELLAEKVRAAATRYRARDYADLYFIIKAGRIIDLSIVEKKFKSDNAEFTKVDIFKNTNKICKNWNKDLSQVLKRSLDFKEVMNTLADYFDLKSEKEKMRLHF